MLEKLGEHHRLIYEIIKRNPRINSSKLILMYNSECRKIGLNPKSPRTLNNYLKELTLFRHVKSERANVRGNVRIFETV